MDLVHGAADQWSPTVEDSPPSAGNDTPCGCGPCCERNSDRWGWRGISLQGEGAAKG